MSPFLAGLPCRLLARSAAVLRPVRYISARSLAISRSFSAIGVPSTWVIRPVAPSRVSRDSANRPRLVRSRLGGIVGLSSGWRWPTRSGGVASSEPVVSSGSVGGVSSLLAGGPNFVRDGGGRLSFLGGVESLSWSVAADAASAAPVDAPTATAAAGPLCAPSVLGAASVSDVDSPAMLCSLVSDSSVVLGASPVSEVDSLFGASLVPDSSFCEVSCAGLVPVARDPLAWLPPDGFACEAVCVGAALPPGTNPPPETGAPV